MANQFSRRMGSIEQQHHFTLYLGVAYQYIPHQHNAILLSKESKRRDRQPNNPNRANGSSKSRASSRRVVTTITAIARSVRRLISIPISTLRDRRHIHVVDRRVDASADRDWGTGQTEEHDAKLALALSQSGTVGLGAGTTTRVPDAVADVGLFRGRGGVLRVDAEALGDCCVFLRGKSALVWGGGHVYCDFSRV
jgi:hypothetical protein